jgi:hypothetical protein
MKTILSVAALVALFSCVSRRELQAEMVNAEVVKIDTVFRYTNNPQQLLTWRDENNIEYLTYASLYTKYSVGSRMMVLVKR